MTAAQIQPIPSPKGPPRNYTPSSWDRLSPAEQRRQIRELIASPYWNILPQDIKERFLDLYRAW